MTIDPSDRLRYDDRLRGEERGDSRPPILGTLVDRGHRPADDASGSYVYAFMPTSVRFVEAEGESVTWDTSPDETVYAVDVTPIEVGGNPRPGEVYVLKPQGDRWVFSRGGTSCGSLSITVYGYGGGFDAEAKDGTRFHVTVKQYAPGTDDDGKVLFDDDCDDATPAGDIIIPAVFDLSGLHGPGLTVPHAEGVVGVASFRPEKSLRYQVWITDSEDDVFLMREPSMWVPLTSVPRFGGLKWTVGNYVCDGKDEFIMGQWFVETFACTIADRLTCDYDQDTTCLGIFEAVRGTEFTLHTFDGDATQPDPRGKPIETTDTVGDDGYAWPRFPGWVPFAALTGDAFPAGTGVWVDWSAPGGCDPPSGTDKGLTLQCTPRDRLPTPKATYIPTFLLNSGQTVDIMVGLKHIDVCKDLGNYTKLSEIKEYVWCQPKQFFFTLWDQAVNVTQPPPRDPFGNRPLCPTLDPRPYLGDSVGKDYELNIVGQQGIAAGFGYAYSNIYVTNCFMVKIGVGDPRPARYVLGGIGGVSGHTTGGIVLTTYPDRGGCPDLSWTVDPLGNTIVGGWGAGDPGPISLVMGGSTSSASCEQPTSGPLYMEMSFYHGWPCPYGPFGSYEVVLMQIGVWSL